MAACDDAGRRRTRHRRWRRGEEQPTGNGRRFGSVEQPDERRVTDGGDDAFVTRMPLATSTRARPRTKQAFVYQTLRDAIMRCDLMPGERLVIDDLARRLQVSSIPVREALQLLQSDGLIVNVPHVGATVAPLTRESVTDVFTLLEGLGHVATRLVAERGDLSALDELDALVAEMDGAIATSDYEAWAALNTTFHLTIAKLTRLPLLFELTERVFDQWLRVRRYFFHGVLILRAEHAQAEHRAMLAAMHAGDLDHLTVLVGQHNRGALGAYMAYLDEHAPADSSGPASGR
jgi:DNA-binding GntR family transcriptional regulator